MFDLIVPILIIMKYGQNIPGMDVTPNKAKFDLML